MGAYSDSTQTGATFYDAGRHLRLTVGDEPVIDIIRHGVAQPPVDPSGTAGVGATPASATPAADARRSTP